MKMDYPITLTSIWCALQTVEDRLLQEGVNRRLPGSPTYYDAWYYIRNHATKSEQDYIDALIAFYVVKYDR